MKHISIILFIGVLLFQIAYSQEVNNERVKSFFWQVDTTAVKSENTTATKALNTQFKIPQGYEFVRQVIKGSKNGTSETDELGYTHERYKQYYKGIEIESSDIRVRHLDGVFISANGEYIDISDIDVSIILSKDEAIQKAIAYIDAKEYMWENETENHWLISTNNKITSFYPTTEIVICENEFNDEDTLFYVAYKIDIFAKKPFRHDYVYVDAKTGDILDIVPILENANGRAETRYSGVRTISTEPYNGGYRLMDYSRGDGIETYNLNGTSITYPIYFIDNDNNWTASEYDNADKDNGALDAHWGMMMTYDYFKNIHGRNSYDGDGSIIKSYVHDKSYGENAGWNRLYKYISYGDGGVDNDIYTTLDIVSHEFGHGVCQTSANILYRKEFGAINESLSDIWGACVVNYAAPEKNCWWHGYEKSYTGAPQRNLSDPKSSTYYHHGRGYHCIYPNTYEGDYWLSPSGDYDNGGIHINSSVMNYWFYILSVGKSGTIDDKPDGEHYYVEGICMENAAKIVYRAENSYMTKRTNFSRAREYTIIAAADLYGKNSCEVQRVTDAWHAVGVGDKFSCSIKYIDNKSYTSGTTKIDECRVSISNTTVQNNATVKVHATNWIKLKTGTKAKAGSYFLAYVAPCENCESNRGKHPNLKSVETGYYANEEKENIYNSQDEKENVLIFPNPNTGSFTIQSNNIESITQIQVINPLGQIIYSIQNPNDNTITLPSGAKGTYFVRITTETESITKKILVE
jgi:Zn-dependent metalloprotease